MLVTDTLFSEACTQISENSFIGMTGKKIEIECFLKIFAKHETLKNPLFSDFQNELIHEKELSRLKKKIKPLHSVVLFLLNWILN